MKIKPKRLILCLTLIAVIIFVPIITTALIYAQERATFGLVINAVKREYSMTKGQTVTDSFKARHDFQDPNFQATFYISTQDFENDGLAGRPKFLGKNRNKPFSTLEDWIHLDQSQIDLTHYGEEKEISYSITIPDDAQPGSYYAAILLSDTKSTPETTGTQVGLESKLGLLILLTIPDLTVGDQGNYITVSSAEAVTPQLTRPFLGIFDYEPTILDVVLKDDSIYYAIPQGDIFIYQNDITNPVATGKFNEAGDAVLSKSSRQFFFQWDDDVKTVLPEKLSEIKGFKPQSSKQLPLGYYNATFKILYTDRATNALRYVDESVSFFVFPWRITLIILAVIVLIYIGIRIYVRRAVHKEVSKKRIKPNFK